NHILHYYFTAVVSDVTHGLPQYSVVGYVDNLFFGRYSSDTRHPELLIPSLKGLNDLIKELTINAHDKENADIIMMKLIMSSLNKTGDGAFHVFQIKYSCELREDGGIHGNEDFAFDAKEFMTFDTENPQYLPLVQEALIVTQKWNGIFAKLKTVYMENVCISHLKFYLSHLKKDLEKKVSPKVKVSSSESESGIKLHCRVYGFYPRDVEVKWIKNGRDEIYSEESAEILPNPDGTYQIRVSVEVTPEEGATYSCHVDHSSLENPLVTPFEANNGKLLYILIAVGVTIILFAVVLGVFIYRKKSVKTYQFTIIISSAKSKLILNYLPPISKIESMNLWIGSAVSPTTKPSWRPSIIPKPTLVKSFPLSMKKVFLPPHPPPSPPQPHSKEH
ncbi:hypothetical protein XELAEV_18040569mg, partial [Xenopus laevis]